MSISHAEIQAASAAKLLAGANDPRGVAQARELFRQARQAALTKAEEYVVEGSDSGAATEHARNQQRFMPLLKVLLRWAEAERGRNQFKAAKRLYEELVTHTALRDLAVVWLSYAGFCAGRGKVKAARKVYVRGCQTATLPQAQSDLLYNAFLNFENAILQASGPSATAGPVVATDATADSDVKTTIASEAAAPGETIPGTADEKAEQSTAVAEEEAKSVESKPKLLTLQALRALVEQTALPAQDVSVETTKTPVDAVGDKFKEAEAKGNVVMVDDFNEGAEDSAGHGKPAADKTAAVDAAEGAGTGSSAGGPKASAGPVADIEPAKRIDDPQVVIVDDTDVPLEIIKAATQAAASEMLNYALPSGAWAPRLFLTPNSSSSIGGGNTAKLPQATMVQLGASLKQGGANCVFEIVDKLREYQRLKEEGLRLRRQAVIKEYRTQVAMAWLKCSMGGSDAKTTKSLKKESGSKPDPSLLAALAQKLKRDQETFDITARRELEAMRRQLQSLCQKIGIPEMRPTATNDQHTLKRQRQVLDLIERAGKRIKK
eukprot:g4744.t1